MLEPEEIALLLEIIRNGVGAEKQQALNRLVEELYDDFLNGARARLHPERHRHSFATTDLAHEALIRLLQGAEIVKASNWYELRRAFDRAVCQVLIDDARKRRTDRRGGGWHRDELSDVADPVERFADLDALVLAEALEALTVARPLAARVLKLRFFNGCTMPEITELLNDDPEFAPVSLRTVEAASQRGLGELFKSLSPGE